MDETYLQTYVKIFEETEVPERFAVWAGICSLLAALERRVWVEQELFQILPNFYVVLVAASGQKKSTPIKVAERIVKSMDAPPHLIAEKISKERLISELSEHDGGLIVGDELGMIIDQRSYQDGADSVLIKLWDGSDVKQSTVSRGEEIVNNAYLSILAGATTETIRKALPVDAIGAGLASRMLFVYSEDRPPPVARIRHNRDKIDELQTKLKLHLDVIRGLEGEVQIEEPAWEIYEKDYNYNYYHSPFVADPNLQGYLNRRTAHLFKTAIAIMVAEGPQLTLNAKHMRTAMTLLEDVEQMLPRVMGLITASETGSMASAVWAYIQGHQTVSRRDVVRQFSHKLSAYELGQVLDTLFASGRIVYDNDGRDVLITAKG
jgi:hypothetical protein